MDDDRRRPGCRRHPFHPAPQTGSPRLPRPIQRWIPRRSATPPPPPPLGSHRPSDPNRSARGVSPRWSAPFIRGAVPSVQPRAGRDPHPLPSTAAAAAIAAVVGMLAAGLFEYNFGDSEFLMLFLVLVTLPFAEARHTDGPATART